MFHVIKDTLEHGRLQFESDILVSQLPSGTWAPSTQYRLDDLIAAVESMATKGVGKRKLYLGEAPGDETAGLVNLAAFLAQSMQETIQYDACDENSWDLVNGGYPLSNSCGQLGQSYGDYKCYGEEAHMACEVDPEMELTATTNAKWYGAPGPLSCAPRSKTGATGYWSHSLECNKPWASPPEYCTAYEGQKAGGVVEVPPSGAANVAGRTDTEGCCFWGRGVIQTTGVCNFGKLNYYLGARAAKEGRDALYPSIDFCKRPDKICNGNPELKWIAGFFYWMESVQAYDVGGWNYQAQLRAFVDGGMAGDSFINSVSGIVNRGCHNPPCATGALHAGPKRVANFKKVLSALGL